MLFSHYARALATLLLAGIASASTPETTISPATVVTFRVGSQPPQLPNPNVLSSQTRAVLTRLGEMREAPLTVDNTFVFTNLTVGGSYLLDVYSPSHYFMPLRVDVAEVELKGVNEGIADGTEAEISRVVRATAWKTYRGNDWNNKGEQAPVNAAGEIYLRVGPPKVFFVERPTFSVLDILKNPMILMAMVSLVMFMGMPYLLDNMDPEMRAEFEKQQQSNPINGILSGQASRGGGKDLDVAGFLAGSKKKS